MIFIYRYNIQSELRNRGFNSCGYDWFWDFSNEASECLGVDIDFSSFFTFSLLNYFYYEVFELYKSMVIAQRVSWYGFISIDVPRFTRELNDTQESAFLQWYVDQMGAYITIKICLRRDVKPTLLLNGVIFDVIDGSLNVSFSPYLMI